FEAPRQHDAIARKLYECAAGAIDPTVRLVEFKVQLPADAGIDDRSARPPLDDALRVGEVRADDVDRRIDANHMPDRPAVRPGRHRRASRSAARFRAASRSPQKMSR